MPVPVLGSPAVARVDLVVAQAATNRYRLTYEAGDPGYEVPVDLTGWSAACQLRRSAAADAVLAVPDVTLDAGGGVTLELPAAATAGWDDVDGGAYDLYLTAPPAQGGDVVRLAQGRFTVDHRVTR